MWIKLNDDLYCLPATPDPQEVVSISVLESEIADLQSRIDSIHLIEIPEGASEEVVVAIDLYNQQNGIGDKVVLESQLEPKIKLLTELKAI